MSNDEFKLESKSIVCGKVKRKWVADSGKYGTLTLEVPGRGQYDEQINMRCFKDGPMAKLNTLIPGSVVKAFCAVGSDVVKNKAGEAVIVDGYKKYIEVLTIKALVIDETSIKAAQEAARKAAEQNDNDSVGGDPSDDVPAGW